ncbi:MAG: MG2 domain-containing protein, partial [Planctomycetaceae bacterium]
KPKRLDWNSVNVGDIGYRLIQQNENQYLGERVANWDLELQPRENHFDSRTTVATPLQKAGAYLLTAKVADGNISRIVIWIDDTVIVHKPLDGRTLYYVADAVTGKPIAGANVEFFGFQSKQVGRNDFTVLTRNFAEATDADGQVIPEPKQVEQEFQWLIAARTKGGRLAYLGFENVWYGQRYDAEYNENKVFIATDRPVYRPEQPVKFNVWVRNAKYDQDDVSNFANTSFTLRITNPKGETALDKAFRSDAFGGFSGEYALPGDATLGHYGIALVNSPGAVGGGSFRVEEYKKPEYEVAVEAPSEPVMLGEKITATIRAKYYFGAPVTHAKVHYKVTRTNHNSHWYPVGIWDWFYGPGYWWFASDYDWYPGWRMWGCVRPYPFWWPQRSDPPEVVLDNEVEIGEDGTVKVEIDTALAKAIHGDQDHRYEITAEVIDQSRRTIVGNGQVLVAREPFKVFAWVNRGHYRTGDVVEASFKAQTLDRKPVAGKGVLSLLQIKYDKKGEPVETEVETWNLDANERGEANQSIKPSQPGQYRLSYKVTDAKQHTIEGGYVFTVTGPNFDGGQYRFDDLELITDKREYQPGEKVRLMINTNRVGSTVALFVRPANGVYPRPQILRLTGKSTVHEISIDKKDMPNFFIEAFTISDGKIHTETREVVVPPEKRVANVEVLPSSKEYKPGAAAKITLKLTDLMGKPFIGSTVVTVYDKSVEYISGGSNVPEIREFFWKWRRSHQPQTHSTLDRVFYNLLKQGETAMVGLGVFGDLVDTDSEIRGALPPGNIRMFSRGRRELAAGKAMAPGAGRAIADEAAAMPMALEAAPAQGAQGGPETLVQPTVRKEFADTAFWAVALSPNSDGIVEVALTMPENLTTWKIRAWTMGHGTKVGQGEAEVVTNKNLLVRMQAPRFFTETDEVVLSANVHNYLPTPKTAQVVLELDGDQLAPMGNLTQSVNIPSGGETRVDWRVKAAKPGEAVVRMKALTDEESDAMEMRFPVYIHGMLKTESYTGVIRPDKMSSKISIKVPDARRISDTRLEVRYSPSLAGALVDALPYLVSYPHKTTDTTLNRFLPTVITQNLLKRMNVNLEQIKNKRTNLNAQELGEAGERAEQWRHYKHNPVFDQAEVERMVKQGLQALTEMQLTDGGWGWFSGWGEHSDAHTTALVVHGLQIAQQNGVAIVPGVMENGAGWLKRYQADQIKQLDNAKLEKKPEPYKLRADNLDALVFMVLVDADVVENAMLDYLYRDRTELSVYAKGMFGLALHKVQDIEKLNMIIRNIDQFLVQDEENQTAYLKIDEGYWWYWYGSEIEANAYYLKLLAKTRPDDPKASRLVKYLLNNRKHATYWDSTRDTAIAIEAMADYLQASGEDKPDMTVEILYDGKKQKEVKINADNLFSFDNTFDLVGDAVDSGEHTIELRKQGKGPLYFNAYVTNFTQEEMITRAGLELKVNRKYYRLIRDDKQEKVAGSRGQAVDQRVEKYRREALANLASLKSGELVEIELEIDSKNDYEYLVFEDMKAAGFEPVDVQSGYADNGLRAYIELRDERVTMFSRTLARGKHSVSYRVRAEIPGRFSALPTKAYAMYAPELRGNSDEIKLTIVDE